MTNPNNIENVQLSAPVPAAQYLRMSTEHQQYSPDNQAAAIQRYAEEKGYVIEATYSDEGRSGVTTGGRTGLMQMIADVEAGQARFAAILVYDVSRWGRFQNPDEAAVYEVRCRWAGVPVHYVAEPFENDGSILSSLMKTLKRAMAAEYSRELSAKVTQGHLRMLERGFHQGGFTCYGLQRVLIDSTGRRKQILKFRDRKHLQSDRVILEPGPPEHVAIVNEVYRRFLDGEGQSSLVSALNKRGDLPMSGRPWTESAMRRMLTSECYIGNVVWGKHHSKLGQSRQPVAKSNWIRNDGVYPCVVEPSLFWQVQAEINRRKSRFSTEEILAGLRMLLKKHGTLNRTLINKTVGLPCAPAIVRRFGSLRAAYAQVGFSTTPYNKYTKINRRLVALTINLGKRLARQIGLVHSQHEEIAGVLASNGVSIVLLLGRYIDRMAGPTQWFIEWSKLELATVAIIGLMDSRNHSVRAYHVVTGPDVQKLRSRKNRDDGKCLEAFAQPNLAACVAHVRNHMAGHH